MSVGQINKSDKKPKKSKLETYATAMQIGGTFAKAANNINQMDFSGTADKLPNNAGDYALPLDYEKKRLA